MGHLMFCCPESGKEFDSGFQADHGDLADLSPVATVRVRCRICWKIHAFAISDGWIRKHSEFANARA